jgi:peptide/nickel transport system permease protein
LAKAQLDTAQIRIPKPWIWENIAVLVLAGAAAWLVSRAWRRAYWREAFRRVAQNRLALPALAVVLLYSLLALLDSVSWKDAPSDLRPKTLLDRVFQKEKERWYSAPLAATEYRERRAQALEHGPHLLGTDSAGEDVFYLTLKGVRTALFIGMFTTLIIIPVAAFMGIVAGYFRGWIDDTVQLLYTMLASIPEILLLVSLMIVLGRGLPQLCFALGVTSWVGLCRLVRGETLKLRELEFVQGSKALGAGTARLLWSHILPNVMHIIVIAFVLRFSGLVMTEVVLSYLGIGVAPGTGSWGLMIDAARLELARDPIVWWSLAAAFGAMFLLILSFNYFGDVLRDALDPRLRER